MLEMKCPRCGKALEISDELGGQKGTCPHCGGLYKAPAHSFGDATPEEIEARRLLEEPEAVATATSSKLRAALIILPIFLGVLMSTFSYLGIFSGPELEAQRTASPGTEVTAYATRKLSKMLVVWI